MAWQSTTHGPRVGLPTYRRKLWRIEDIPEGLPTLDSDGFPYSVYWLRSPSPEAQQNLNRSVSFRPDSTRAGLSRWKQGTPNKRSWPPGTSLTAMSG